MTWQELMMDIFDRIASHLAQVLDGITTEELNLQPAPDACSIGFLTWQLTRNLDRDISELQGMQQLWNSEKWYSEFNRTPDPAETGDGFNMDEISRFKAPDSITIMKYHHDVLERVREYIGSILSEMMLEEDSYSHTIGRRTPVYRRFSGLVSDSLRMVGQAAYVRGLIHGIGWQKG